MHPEPASVINLALQILASPKPMSTLKPLYDVIAAEPLPGFNLKLTFDNGEVRRFAMANFLDSAAGVFIPLRNMAQFKQVYLANGTVAWPNGADLDPELLYEKSIPETIEDVPEPTRVEPPNR